MTWVNKMTHMTTKVHERQYEDRQASSIIEVLLDSQVKHELQMKNTVKYQYKSIVES